jgi:hypothetical protein
MGQQLNKIQKRRRRQDYLARKEAKAKETAAAKGKTRRVAKKPAAETAAAE